MATYLTCGHQADPCCSGVDVTWGDEDCDPVEGFHPVQMFGIFCHKCAMEQAANTERDKIVAWLRSVIDTPMYPSLLANEIEAREHLKD